MLKIINAHKLLSGKVVKTNLFFKDTLVFIEKDIFTSNSEQQLCYIGIQKINHLTQEVDKFIFSKPANLITYTSVQDIVYYAYIEKQEGKYFIDIYKINCSNWNQENILRIKTDIDSDNCKNDVKLALNSIMIGITERYAIIALPNIIQKYNQPFFESMFLIDSLEKKAYAVPNSIGMSDTLMRMDRVLTVSDGKYILFKTGRIRAFEKKKKWELQVQENICENYFDQLETIIACSTDEFVKSVKQGTCINTKCILETCEVNGAADIINIDNSTLIYSIQHFSNKSTEIKSYDLKSKKLETITTDIFDRIMYFNKSLYGFMVHDTFVDIYNINKNYKVLNTNEKVIYIDDKIFITFKLNDKRLSCIVHSLNNIEQTNTFECQHYNFDYEKNTLILY